MRRVPKNVVLAVAGAVLLMLAVSVFAMTRSDAGPKPKAVAAADPEATPAPTDARLPEEPAGSDDEKQFVNAEPIPEQTAPEPFATASDKPAPKATKTVAPQGQKPGASDSCNRSYGPDELCLPSSLPDYLKTLKDKCTFLASHGLTNITVPGPDRLGLDPDKNGVACD